MSLWTLTIISLLALSSVNIVTSSRILAAFPTPARSHQIVFRAVTDALIERGHHLTILTTSPYDAKGHPNVTQIDLSASYDIIAREWDVAETRERDISIMEFAQRLIVTSQMVMEQQFSNIEVQNLINDRNEYFDVLLVEIIGFTPMLAFGEHFKVPIVGISSIETIHSGHEAVGNVVNPIAHPEMILKKTEDMNFFERCLSVIVMLYLKFVQLPLQYQGYDQLTQKYFGRNASSSEDLNNQIDLLLINSHPALGFVRPLVPQSVQLGFLHIKPPQPLPSDLQAYLDNSKHGVIYISFGSIVKSSTISEQKVNIFLNAFRSLKYDVIWKWETDVLRNKPDNVKIVKWLPQQDLLAHKKVKLFITQCGQQSWEEAVDRGVPILAIPFMTDQYGNAIKVENRRIGRNIDINQMTEEMLTANILELINNSEYKRNIQRLGDLIRDQPMKPVDEAVWWIEYVIRHQDTSHLKYKGQTIPFYQYHFLDIMGVVILILFCGVLCSFYVMKKIYKKLVQHNPQVMDKLKSS